MTSKLTAKQQAHFDKMPERNKETMRAFWASEAQASLGSSDAHRKAGMGETPSASVGEAELVPPETERRRIYVERYGKRTWTRAVELAGRHRTRAAKDWSLTEHWSAWEWLDLCAQTDFRCTSCGSEAALEPHHRTSMVFGGSNTIGNIVPICRDCHKPLYSGEVQEHWEKEGPRLQREREQEQLRKREEWAEAWFEHQHSLLTGFARGTAVWRHGEAHNSVPGVIVRVLPPERGGLPKLLEDPAGPASRREARALVYWPSAGRVVLTPWRVTEIISLQEITKADLALWIARQQEKYQPERVGETVRLWWGRKAAHGIILRVLPPSLGDPWDFGEDASASEIAPRWRPWSGTIARVRWDNGKDRISYKALNLEQLTVTGP